MADASPDDDMVSAVFDQVARWRADIIVEFRLRGAERCAAASPTPGFPQLLDSVMFAVADAPPGLWLDVGGGLGGTASWIERTHRRSVVVADASFRSVDAARRLFGTLDVMRAEATALPMPDGAVSVAIVSGLVSLLDGVDALFGELRRVLAAGGRIAITDLWSSTSTTFRDHPNTFWSVEDIEDRARDHGLVLQHVAVADLTTGWWPKAAIQVNDEIAVRHSASPHFAVWRRDLDHLDHAMAAGTVMPAAIVLTGRS